MKGHLRKRGKNSWAIAIYVGRDHRGKPKYKWHTVRGGKRKAQDECTRLLNELATGEYVEPSKMTVREYLAYWLENYAKLNVAGRTFERYSEIVRLHLVPALGDKLLTKLQPLSIQGCYVAALQSGRKDKRAGLSAQTVVHHHRVLREALQQAVRWKLLVRNPADAVDPPKVERREMQVLDEHQTKRLLAVVVGTRLYIPVLLAVTTGLRRGEILALRWQDIDLDQGTLAVRRSLEQTRGGNRFKEPKTQKARRVVALPALTTEALRKLKVEQAKARLLIGAGYADEGLVCARIHGTRLDPAETTAAFAALIKKADLPKIRFHDLRHSHATQLLRQHVHPKVVSERLGHSTIGITLDVYSHVLPGMQEEAARRIDRALRDAGVGVVA